MPPPVTSNNDVVFVCVDFEGRCPARTGMSDVGLALLDTRDLKRSDGWLPPGDRGVNWMTKVRSTHLRIVNADARNPVHSNNGWHEGSWCKGDPAAFMYGKSKFITEKEIALELENWLKNARQRHRTAAEEKEKELRTIILVTWASNLEEHTFYRYGLDWFTNKGEAWDVQQLNLFQAIGGRKHNNPKIKLEDALWHMSHPYTDPAVSSRVFHNGANDATFELHAMLSALLITPNQYDSILSNIDKQPLALIVLPPLESYKRIIQTNKDLEESEQSKILQNRPGYQVGTSHRQQRWDSSPSPY